MLTIAGLIREKLGRSFHKVLIVRFIGEFETKTHQIKEIKTRKGTYGKSVLVKTKIPRYRVVARHYFSPIDTVWRASKLGRAFEIYPTDEALAINEGHLQFIDFDTGNTLNFGVGQIGARENPVKLDEKIETDSIKEFVKQNKTAIAWAFLGIGILMGVFIGFVIGQNIEGIAGAVKGGADVIIPQLTPTPTPIIIGGLP